MSNSTDQQIVTPRQRRGCLFFIRRGLLGFAIILVALVVLGVIYQTVVTQMDKTNFAPRGELYAVNGHQMHMVCMGEGSPTVVLEGGGFANSLWWYRIQNQLAQHTQVCAYDRPGMGWSEPTTEPRDAITITSELHALLEQAGVSAPYIMAGHSFGAQLSRIYAAQYPDDVVGLVLVDSAYDVPQFSNQQEFEDWVASNNILQVMLWGATRVGLMRLLTPATFQQWGFPTEITDELGALRSTNQAFDSDAVERYPFRMELNEALAAAENFGDLPMAILWATEGLTLSPDDQARIDAARLEVAGFSSNSRVYFVEGADHGSILGNEQYSQQVTNAILDVIAAAQTSEPLAQ